METSAERNFAMRVKVREWRGSWCTDYRVKDAKGKPHRHIKAHKNKREAEAYAKTIEKEHDSGTHTPASQSPTVAEAAQLWINHIESEGRERSTVRQYEQHRDHIVKRIGSVKLAELNRPRIERFRDTLLKDMSRPMARKVLTSLKSLIGNASRIGRAAHNPATGVKIGMDKRHKQKLKIGVDIPTTAEVIKMMEKAPTARGRTYVTLAAFSGLRASEVRGLRWCDVHFKDGTIHVAQRADRYNKMGSTKSSGSQRTLTVIPRVTVALRKWKDEVQPKDDKTLVFASENGTPLDHTNFDRRVWQPVAEAARLADRYTMHSLRHYYASLLINSPEAGGFGLLPKDVQERMGHATIAITLDTYGHLFPKRDDREALKAAEKRIFALAG
jgi:integrase